MPKHHRVSAGDCLSSIAFRHGLAPETIWGRPENDDLRRRRPNMHQLVPGDDVFIPDLRPRIEEIHTAHRHRFRVLNTPEKLNIRLNDARANPRAHLPYCLTVDGRPLQGTTDEEGRIEVFIPPDAANALLRIDCEGGPEEYQLELGYDNPEPHSPELLRMLRRAGFLGDADDIPTVIDALRAYQRGRGLAVTGDADLATTRALTNEIARRP